MEFMETLSALDYEKVRLLLDGFERNQVRFKVWRLGRVCVFARKCTGSFQPNESWRSADPIFASCERLAVVEKIVPPSFGDWTEPQELVRGEVRQSRTRTRDNDRRYFRKVETLPLEVSRTKARLRTRRAMERKEIGGAPSPGQTFESAPNRRDAQSTRKRFGEPTSGRASGVSDLLRLPELEIGSDFRTRRSFPETRASTRDTFSVSRTGCRNSPAFWCQSLTACFQSLGENKPHRSGIFFFSLPLRPIEVSFFGGA